MKPVQYFDDDDLKRCRNATPQQIAEFLEQFRLLQTVSTELKPKSKLISIKIPQDMLTTFRARCEIEGVKYQTKIKCLMSAWIKIDQT